MLMSLTCAGATLAACGGGAPPAPSANQGIVENTPVPAAVRSIPLVDQAGRATSLGAFGGRYVVIAPFLSLCQDECPLVTGAFIALQHDVEAAGLGKEFAFLEITVDPGRDTPYRLAQYAKRFGASWPLLTGTAANLHRLWSYFGVSYQVVAEEKPAKIDWLTGQPLQYDVTHTDGYLLLDTRGHLRFVDANAPDLHGQLGHNLSSLLNRGGIQNLRDPRGVTWSVSDALASLSWLAGRSIPATATT
jgi:cytochrome oxidase Cu insertion factor (SCO1/SenC/PrrC family)